MRLKKPTWQDNLGLTPPSANQPLQPPAARLHVRRVRDETHGVRVFLLVAALPGFFFMLKGRWIDKRAGKCEVDFGMTGGPSRLLEGTYDRGEGLIKWANGNYFRQMHFIQPGD